MKRLLTFLILLSTFNIALAQEKTKIEEITTVSVDSVTLSETERIVDKYTGKISDGFNKLVETATPYAEEGFVMVVKLQYAKAVANLSILFIGILFLYWFYYNFKQSDFTEEDWNRYATLSIITGIASIILLTMGLTNLYNAIMLLIAPEWYAVKEIINLLK
jgi:hypothetical protein